SFKGCGVEAILYPPNCFSTLPTVLWNRYRVEAGELSPPASLTEPDVRCYRIRLFKVLHGRARRWNVVTWGVPAGSGRESVRDSPTGGSCAGCGGSSTDATAARCGDRTPPLKGWREPGGKSPFRRGCRAARPRVARDHLRRVAARSCYSAG